MKKNAERNLQVLFFLFLFFFLILCVKIFKYFCFLSRFWSGYVTKKEKLVFDILCK